MKAVGWMVAASVMSSIVAFSFVGAQARVPVLLGMVGPLLAVSGSWMLAERTYRHRPEGLTAVMIAGFAFKLVFFGAYVAVIFRMLGARHVPFVASFASYFIGLYLMEALYLRRLFR